MDPNNDFNNLEDLISQFPKQPNDLHPGAGKEESHAVAKLAWIESIVTTRDQICTENEILCFLMEMGYTSLAFKFMRMREQRRFPLIGSTMTVAEAFEKAYGIFPDKFYGCYIGTRVGDKVVMRPTIANEYEVPACWNGLDGFDEEGIALILGWHTDNAGWETFGPDIRDEPAENFRKFFDDKYRAILDEAQKDDD